MRKAENPASQFLVRLIELWQNGHPQQYPTLHDPLAVAVSFRPALVETQTGSVQVETASPLTYGITMFTGPGRSSTAPATTQVAREVNVRGFLDLFVERLSAPPRKR
jgi:inosine-uridine nucleoside N-ribohydrolase